MLDRRVLQIVLGLFVAGVTIAWPGRTDRVLVRIVGLALVALAVVTILSVVSRSPDRPTADGAGGLGRWARVALAIGSLALGLVLTIDPDRSIVASGRLCAIALAVWSCHELVTRRPGRAWTGWGWPIAKAAAGLATAALLAAYPAALLATATTLLALGWAIVGIVALAQTFSPVDDRTWDTTQSGDLVIAWLEQRPQHADAREELYEKVLFEGDDTRRRLTRFAVLMGFAGVIASMGVITDSTAVVIGAMLIAPLMTPLMGIAISVVMGWPNRLSRHAAIAGLGVVLAIAIGVVLGLLAPTTIDPATNTQIVARSTPTILDLITAIAAGGAGAYGLSRRDVSDALPGVAIAISLVPPLSVVGIAWSQGAWADGNGALLLFVTNALAIVVVGGATFVLTGVTPIRRVGANQRRVRTASASIVAIGALVVAALTVNGGQATREILDTATIERVAAAWVDGSDEHTFVQADHDGDVVTVVLLGPAESSPNASSLRADLEFELGRSVIVDVRLLVQERQVDPTS